MTKIPKTPVGREIARREAAIKRNEKKIAALREQTDEAIAILEQENAAHKAILKALK